MQFDIIDTIWIVVQNLFFLESENLDCFFWSSSMALNASTCLPSLNILR